MHISPITSFVRPPAPLPGSNAVSATEVQVPSEQPLHPAPRAELLTAARHLAHVLRQARAQHGLEAVNRSPSEAPTMDEMGFPQNAGSTPPRPDVRQTGLDEMGFPVPDLLDDAMSSLLRAMGDAREAVNRRRGAGLSDFESYTWPPTAEQSRALMRHFMLPDYEERAERRAVSAPAGPSASRNRLGLALVMPEPASAAAGRSPPPLYSSPEGGYAEMSMRRRHVSAPGGSVSAPNPAGRTPPPLYSPGSPNSYGKAVAEVRVNLPSSEGGAAGGKPPAAPPRSQPGLPAEWTPVANEGGVSPPPVYSPGADGTR